MSAVRKRFDASYYRRFYENPRTRAVSLADVRRHVDFVAAYLKHLGLGVDSILDLGCGLGLMRAPMMRAFPDARYTGVEISGHLCQRLGWQRGSVVDFASSAPFDLVICHDVIQYLDDDEATRAIANLARLSRAAVMMSVLTREDWENACDRSRTDSRVHLRETRWYRRRLARRFVNLGGGVYLKREAPTVLWSLECVG